MSTYYISPVAPQVPANRTALLRGAVAVPLLSWFVFCALLSAWSLSNSFRLGQEVWYTSSTVLLIGVVVFVVWALLTLPTSGAGPASSSVRGGKGPPSQPPPLEGAPCPVPIRPAPPLVRSAAEPLPR